MELWCVGDDVYTLEGAITLTAGLPDHNMCLNVTGVYQISTRLDPLGGLRGHGGLG